MPNNDPVASFRYESGHLDELLEFLKQTRFQLRTLRKVRVYQDRVQIIDVNADYFEIDGIGYGASEVGELLMAIGTSFNPKTIHQSTRQPFKEFSCGRRFPWAEDRVM